jgi:hypothetical protein
VAKEITPASEWQPGLINDPGRAIQISLGRWGRGPVGLVEQQALIGPDVLPPAHLRVQHFKPQGGAPTDTRDRTISWQKEANSALTL